MLFQPTPKGDLSMLRKLNKQNISILDLVQSDVSFLHKE